MKVTSKKSHAQTHRTSTQLFSPLLKYKLTLKITSHLGESSQWKTGRLKQKTKHKTKQKVCNKSYTAKEGQENFKITLISLKKKLHSYKEKRERECYEKGIIEK